MPIPVDDEGLCVDRLPHGVGVISVTPSHQSPTGVALSLRRRTALLDFARARDAVIIEDDYDGEFRFGGRPLDALQTLDRDARVFYVGTFSKSLFPALRKGFVVAPAWARAALVTVKHCADSHCDAITQSVLAAFIRDGHLARHVRRMRPIYAARRDALLEGSTHELVALAAADSFRSRAAPLGPRASISAGARARSSRQHGVARRARVNDDYAMTSGTAPALTFGYGVIDAGEIRPALVRFRRELQA